MNNKLNLAVGQVFGRRSVLAGGAALAAIGTLAPLSFALAQRPAKPDPSLEELMAPGPLEEIIVGNKDAKITIIEYASMTCPHCATFHTAVFPKLKEKYIDSGKVRLIFREYPLDPVAIAASMLARCVKGEGPAGFISDLFKRQATWAQGAARADIRLFEMAKQAGFTQDSFDKCLTDQKLYDQVQAVKSRGYEKFGIELTPSFFINGKRYNGRSDQWDAFEKALEPLLKG